MFGSEAPRGRSGRFSVVGREDGPFPHWLQPCPVESSAGHEAIAADRYAFICSIGRRLEELVRAASLENTGPPTPGWCFCSLISGGVRSGKSTTGRQNRAMDLFGIALVWRGVMVGCSLPLRLFGLDGRALSDWDIPSRTETRWAMYMYAAALLRWMPSLRARGDSATAPFVFGSAGPLRYSVIIFLSVFISNIFLLQR